MHISLTDRLDDYVREKVASGLYNNASEVVRDALRRQIEAEQANAAKLQALRDAVQLGIDQADRGETVPFDMARIQAELDDELRA